MKTRLITAMTLLALTACAYDPTVEAYRTALYQKAVTEHQPQAGPPGPKATPGELDTAKQMYRLCLVAKELQLDDGISDAEMIARVLRTSCPDEYAVLLHMSTQGEALFSAIAEGVAIGTQRMATRVVLEERAKRAHR